MPQLRADCFTIGPSAMLEQDNAAVMAPAAVSEQQLLQLDELILALSTGFINLESDRIDAAIEDGLRCVVKVLDIDRCTMSRVQPATGDIRFTYAWSAVPYPRAPATSFPAHWPWTYASALRGQGVKFSRLDELPAEANVDRSSWERLGLRSHITVPVMVSRELVAMLHFGSFRRERVWPEALLVRLQRLAEIYAIALTRKRGQEELDQATGFERLATEILASLLVAGAGVDDGAMESSLRKIGLFLGVDRATLWERVVGTGELKAAHRWHSEHVSTSVNPMDSAEIAWLSARPGAGSVVHFGRKTDLGPDLGTDLGTLRNLGVRSMLAVPFSVSDEVAGALSFVSLQEERTWPERLILGLRLLAEVFASVHARRSVERRERAAQLDAAQWRERLAHLVRVHTVGEMSVALAHEINQPLMAIENYALAARRRANGMPESEKVTELLDKVVAQTARAGKVVRRLRGMVKRHDVETSTVNVERLVVECLDIVRMECELREIHLEPSFAGSLPLIVADEIQIQQVILNLLRNAIEAMEAAHLDVPKTITIETGYEPETGIAVRVADCGPGIPEVEMDRVFDAFYSTKITGLGIGLSICRKLIEAHGGTLVARDNPGGGAEFQITLPVANARSDAAS